MVSGYLFYELLCVEISRAHRDKYVFNMRWFAIMNNNQILIGKAINCYISIPVHCRWKCSLISPMLLDRIDVLAYTGSNDRSGVSKFTPPVMTLVQAQGSSYGRTQRHMWSRSLSCPTRQLCARTWMWSLDKPVGTYLHTQNQEF